MVGHNADGDGFERSTFLNAAIGLPQAVNSIDELLDRSARTTVKKNVLALNLARRYCGMT
jgi:hypothetical protein